MNKYAARSICHCRLVEWADEKHREQIGARKTSADYPGMTMEGRLIANGGQLVSSTKPFEVWGFEFGARSKEIDNLMRLIPEKYGLILRFKYLGSGTQAERLNRWKEVTGKCGKTYYNRLEKAYGWIAEHLGLTENKISTYRTLDENYNLGDNML